MWIELIGIAASVIAIIGVLMNNRRMRACFVLWIVSNGLSALIHVQAGIWSLAARDIVFFVLAVEGWLLWSERKRTCE
ncbi:MAG: nicotinamide mononucleotide transporter [Acholeplasmataceae bacterium]